MIPFDADTEVKHRLRRVGKKFVFSINGVNPDDAGLYQLEIDGVKIFSTELKSKSNNNPIYIFFVQTNSQFNKIFDIYWVKCVLVPLYNKAPHTKG